MTEEELQTLRIRVDVCDSYFMQMDRSLQTVSALSLHLEAEGIDTSEARGATNAILASLSELSRQLHDELEEAERQFEEQERGTEGGFY